MRFDVRFADRVGIAHEVLSVFAARQLNVVAVEVEPPHIYIDAPQVGGASPPEDLQAAICAVPGVAAVAAIDLLPGARRRLHLSALIAALADPVFAVDAQGAILIANPAATKVAGRNEAALHGVALASLFDDAGPVSELLNDGFHRPPCEVSLAGEPFLLDAHPVGDGAGAGGVIILHAPSRIGARLDALQPFPGAGFAALLGDSPPMHALKARAARVAVVDAPLLILGETGTGKELVARACHRASARRDAPFLALNCAALPENLAESELFGYAPGAFSGAQRGGKPGLLELAQYGTVFLDEIGEMSPYLQAKLLRFLSDGTFRRVGGAREQSVDVRIISATHRDLAQMVATRVFREDLYYRLNVLSLDVPPLRARGADVLLLARHFVGNACVQAQRPPCRLTPAAASALQANAWPGNVRQLENVIFRAVTMRDGPWLDVGDLELAGSRVAESLPADAAASATGTVTTVDDFLMEATDLASALAACEQALLARLYPQYPSSRRLAARLNTSHTTIANKLRKYGIGD